MAGIFGFLKKTNNFDSLDIIKNLLEHADQNFRHSSNYKIIDEGTAGLGFSIPEFNSAYPLKSEDDNYFFQLFGEIYLPGGSLLSTDNFEQHFLYPLLKSGNRCLRMQRIIMRTNYRLYRTLLLSNCFWIFFKIKLRISSKNAHNNLNK